MPQKINKVNNCACLRVYKYSFCLHKTHQFGGFFVFSIFCSPFFAHQSLKASAITVSFV